MSDFPRAAVITQVLRRAAWQATESLPSLLLTTLSLLTALPAVNNAQAFEAQPRKQHYGGQTDCVPNLLTSTLAVGAGAPFGTIDWPTVSHRQVAQDTVIGNLLAYVAPTNVTTSLHRATVFTGVLRKTRPQTDVWPNLLAQATPSGQAVPFAATDWPTVSRRNSLSGQFSASVTYQIAPAPVVPTDWPVVLRRQFVLDTNGPNATIWLGSATAALPPFTSVEWPTVARRQIAQDTGSLNVTIRLPASVFVPPILPVDWPTGVRRQVAQDTSSQNQTILATLIVPIAPASTSDQLRKRFQVDSDQPPNVLLSALAPSVAPVVVPHDDADQVRRKGGVQSDDLQNVTIRLPVSIVALPFIAQLDWPTAAIHRAQEPFVVPNLLLSQPTLLQIVPQDLAAQFRRLPAQPADVIVNATLYLPPSVIGSPNGAIRIELEAYGRRIQLQAEGK